MSFIHNNTLYNVHRDYFRWLFTVEMLLLHYLTFFAFNLFDLNCCLPSRNDTVLQHQAENIKNICSKLFESLNLNSKQGLVSKFLNFNLDIQIQKLQQQIKSRPDVVSPESGYVRRTCIL